MTRWGDIYANTPTKKMIALYDYDPMELSPNVDMEVELSFRTGDIITVFGEMDDDGFYMAELRGQRGLVPRWPARKSIYLLIFFILFGFGFYIENH